jgi:predicted Zn-dependent protease
MVKREMLKRFGETVDATLNGTVEDVVADFDAKPAEELWFDFVFDGEFVAVVFGEACYDLLTLGIVQRGGAFNNHGTTSLL